MNTTAPTVTGSAVIGQKLKAVKGKWTDAAPIKYAYQAAETT